MNALVWLGAGFAAVGFLFARKASADVPKPTLPDVPGFDPPTPPVTYGEPTRVALAVPAGWRRATATEVNALPELRSAAVALRSTHGFTSMQYGTLSPFVASDGKTYATWVEQHYHEPEGPVKPWGYHHGVTLLTKA